MDNRDLALGRSTIRRAKACEPCRRNKVTCDHSKPICGRCRKGRRPTACTYLPVGRPVNAASPKTPTSVVASSSNPVVDISVPAIREDACLPVGTEQSQDAPAEATVAEPSPLGYTSFSGIYIAAHKKLWISTPEENTPFSPCSGKEIGQPCSVIGSASWTTPIAPVLDKYLTILSNIPCQEQGYMVFDTHFQPCTSFIQPVARYMLTSLYGAFGQYLSKNRNESQLAELAQTISENTAKTFSDEYDEPSQWMDQFCGTNTRWETLGTLFSYWELGVGNDVPIRQRRQNTRMAKVKYKELMANCLDLANAISETPNCLILYLTYKKVNFDTVLCGSITSSYCQSQAGVVALMTSLNLHAEANSKQKPTLSTEFRRRLFWYIFNSDKTVSTFTGRPPLIGRKYISTSVPLDVSDEVLCSDKSHFDIAISRLNEDGWNTENAIHPTTQLRAHIRLSTIRDELLEMALGNSANYSINDAEKVRARQEQMMTRLPSVLAFSTENILDSSIDMDALFVKIMIHLEYLQNVFFVERLIRRHTKATTTGLLNITFELVSTTLLLWKHRELFSAVWDDFEWMALQYTVPSGGILCLELLKPSLDTSSYLTGLKTTRSEIIQQLTLLVAFFDWIELSISRGHLISDCKIVIQGTLNQILNVSTQGCPPPEAIHWDLYPQQDANFELFDTFDWLRSSPLLE